MDHHACMATPGIYSAKGRVNNLGAGTGTAAGQGSSVTFRPAMMARTRGPALGMANRYRSRLAVCRVSKPTFSSRDSCASTNFLLTSFPSL